MCSSDLLIGGDVGRPDRAEGQVERQSPGERSAALGGVAGLAVGGMGQIFTALDRIGPK